MKTVLYTLGCLLISSMIWAQQKTIQGTVTDNTGPLPGANVVVKRTSNGIQTDFNGNYSIQALEGDTLVFSYIGYITQEIVVGQKNTISVEMASDNTLDEVVVVAQGIRREKKALGYAVSSTLQGKVTGVQITQSSGTAGTGTNVRIRGYSSISGNSPRAGDANQLSAILNTHPQEKQAYKNSASTADGNILYIVDGVPVNPALNKVIESIPASEVTHKVTHKPSKAQKLFGNVGGRHCVVISTRDGNYRIENDESYKALKENQFKSVTYDPLSTFSIDVDRAGYSNIRRMINNGQEIPVDAVKIEEMINYFNYSYDAPVGDRPFAVHTEVAQTPWNEETRLVKIGLKGKELEMDALPPSNLTFLIDVSGSMGAQNKLPLLKSAFKILVDQLRPEDTVAIVVYAGAAGVVLKPTTGDKKQKIMKAIHNLNAGGSTAGGQGIELAYKLAAENFLKKGNNRVILATDGDFNVGMSSDKAMQDLIEEKRASGVFLTCVGFGMGNYKDSKMEILADTGNGNYAYIDTMQEANKFLGKEFGGTMHTIAKDVKLQIEFNPAVVKSYRLIGYENRLLANENFKDDTKDAGEIGVGHTVTALYEIVPVQSDYHPVADQRLKYARPTTGNSKEMLTVKFRYKEPDGSKSKVFEEVVLNEVIDMDRASEDLKFVAAVAMFGMHLRDSKFTNDVEEQDIIALARAGKGVDTDGYRAEFIRLVKSR